MYKVIYWTTKGAEITKTFERIDEACNLALQQRYGLNCVCDDKGDIIFNRAEDLGNGVFVFKKEIRPL